MTGIFLKKLISWEGWKELGLAQLKIAAILLIAWFGNNWEPSYPRNDNKNPTMFWITNFLLVIGAIATMTTKSKPNRVVLLSREQTEEWKGWMQFAFIMYHYYRMHSVYNWIRVFVSSYVWMTGFGNFLYFDKTKDFSIKRVVSMVIRINYFPMLLAAAMEVPLDLYYVVPLHTEGFFMTMITCYVSYLMETKMNLSYNTSRISAILLSLLAHILFYETSAVQSLLFFSDEIHFRFQADKYSAWIGILCGFLMKNANQYMTWAYGGTLAAKHSPTVAAAADEEAEQDHSNTSSNIMPLDRTLPKWIQRFLGVLLIAGWYFSYGQIEDKYTYNPVHPYIFVFPLLGWLMIRNSSKFLTETHSTLLEFLGQNTLETYVLQFHVFMNHNVQYIPVIIPGSDDKGNIYVRTLNMLLCGSIFLVLAVFARKITVITQTTAVNLVDTLQKPMDYMKASTNDNEQDEETTECKDVK